MKQKYKKIALSIFLALFTASSFGLSNDGEIKKAQANTVSGYAFDTSETNGITFYAYPAATTQEVAAQLGLLPVYRLFNAVSTDHIYTTSETEKASAIAAGYAVEPADTTGIAFYAYPNNTAAENISKEGLAPVYQLYYNSLGSRLYTASETEKTNAISGSAPFANMSFTPELSDSNGIAFYVYPKNVTQEIVITKKLIPLYRFHNEASGDYLYTATQNEKDVTVKLASDISNLGPEISVGLWRNSKDGLKDSPFKIKANKNYNIKDKDGNILFQVTGTNETRVFSYTTSAITYEKDDSNESSGKKKKKKKKKKSKALKKSSPKSSKSAAAKVLGASTVKKSTASVAKKSTAKKSAKKKAKKKKQGWLQNLLIPTAYAADKQIITYTEYLKIKVRKNSDTLLEKELGVQELYFDSIDGDNSDMIFDVSKPGSNFDQYRGKIKIKYADDDDIWIINILPLEQYVWGMGEMAGDGPLEHSKVMTVIFRTYGQWYIDYATKYLPYGFRIKSDSGSQIYSGYDHEIAYPKIKPSVEATRGIIAAYNGETALTPYSSWTDGRTRSYEERWGSKDYPWCQSVKDPYGKHPTLNTDALAAAGNHMVGLSAHGSLNLAGDDYKWDYQKILKYYYKGIDITAKY